MVLSVYGNAGFLFNLAKEACSRSQAKAFGSRIPETPDSLMAVIFAALATEAFINEVPDFAKQSTDQPDWVVNIADLGEKVEESNGQINLKLAVMFMALTGKTYDASRQPFQDFAVLVRLRNELAHLKPLDQFERDSSGLITSKPRSILAKLPANILATPPQDAASAETMPLPLPLCVSTPAAAKWACNTLANLVDAIVTAMPTSTFRTTMESYRDQFFQPIT